MARRRAHTSADYEKLKILRVSDLGVVWQLKHVYNALQEKFPKSINKFLYKVPWGRETYICILAISSEMLATEITRLCVQ